MYAQLNSGPNAFNHSIELKFCHPTVLGRGDLRVQGLCRCRSNAIWWLENRIVYFQVLLLQRFAFDFIDLELRSYFARPSFKSSIDCSYIHTRRIASNTAPTARWSVPVHRRPIGRELHVHIWLGLDGGILRCRSRNGIRSLDFVVVRVVLIPGS